MDGWVDVFTKPHTIPVSRKIAVFLVIMAAYTFAVDWFATSHVQSFIETSVAIYGTTVVGVLLVFRTNSANDRWWEARKLWGNLVNDSRNLSIKVSAYIPNSTKEIKEIHRLLVAFPVALMEHLRTGVKLSGVPGFEDDKHDPKHVPLYISEKLVQELKAMKEAKLIDAFEHTLLDVHARALMDICGACERIRNSPIPLSYRAILRQAIGLGLLALPWYLAPDFHYWSIPIVLISAYFIIGMELIAEDIEEPFGVGDDNLTLELYCKNIQQSVTEVLGN